MIPHDKHQYYFEKYLRNEMSYHERMAFDEKMAEDASLKEGFEFYKSHRIAMLHDLLDEHRMNRRDTRFNRLIFLLISLTGIALTFNYYYHYKDTKDSSLATEKRERKPLYTYIPFVNWEKRSEKGDAKKDNAGKTDTVVIMVPADENKEESVEMLEPSTKDEERSANDVFLTDSFITLYDQPYIRQLIAAKKTVSGDTTAQEPETISAKSKSRDKSGQLFVEFWQSPVKYKGYKFNGKKLILYGIELPYEIYVYKDDNAVFLIHPFGETELTEQSNFQTF
jgi:hypothetical protein